MPKLRDVDVGDMLDIVGDGELVDGAILSGGGALGDIDEVAIAARDTVDVA